MGIVAGRGPRAALGACALLLGAATGAQEPRDPGAPAAARERDVATREALVAALVAALADARPGDRIRLAPGDYRGGISIDGLQGAPGRPIELVSRDPADPARIVGGEVGVLGSDVAYVALRDLVVAGASGNGINLDDGGPDDASTLGDTPAHDVVLAGLTVRDVGPRGNRDGIKLSGVVSFRVERCTIERWGDGGSGIDLVGCRDGVIEGCTLRDTPGAEASGVQLKGGSRDVAVLRCRFEDAGGHALNLGGSTGRQWFRPRPEGFEARDLLVEDCAIVGSDAAVAFIGADGATVRHNVIVGPRRWVLRVLQGTQDADFVPCRAGRFEHNVVVYRAAELRAIANVGPMTAPETFVFAGNAWYAADEPARSRRAADELPTAESDGVYGVDPGLRAPEQGDYRLGEAAARGLRGAGPRPPAAGERDAGAPIEAAAEAAAAASSGGPTRRTGRHRRSTDGSRAVSRRRTGQAVSACRAGDIGAGT